MIKKPIESVKKFHKAFEIGYQDKPTVNLSVEKIELRHKLMAEENDEYLDAARKKDLVEVADALGDMLYILCGTIIEHGMQDVIEDVFDEIQQSNMSKLDANGKPIFRKDGKVMKSEFYFRPNIKKFFKKDR